MSSVRPVTIKDVALEAGVSAATVSMALRGNCRISASMRENISSMAKSMGYRRNPAFAALGAMSHRHAASRDGLPIAFIHQPETNGANRRNVLMMSGISRACERLDQLIRLAQFGLPASPRSQIIEPAWNPGKTAVALHFNPKVQ